MNPIPWKQIASNISLTRLTIIIFIASFLIYAVSPQGRPLFLDLTHGAEITRVALTLVKQGDFAHPFFALPTGPTAHTAPGTCFCTRLWRSCLGSARWARRCFWALNLGFLALQLALLPMLSSRLGLGVGPGVLAAAFGMIIQPYRVMLEWEALFTGALMVVLCLLTLAHFRAPRDWGHSALLGFLWGVAMLTNPECVLLLFAWPHIAAMENSPLGDATRAARHGRSPCRRGAGVPAVVCAQLPDVPRGVFYSRQFWPRAFHVQQFLRTPDDAGKLQFGLPLPHSSQHESGNCR